MRRTGFARETAAAHLRLLRNYMKLNGLFNSSSENYHFMNVDLRNFLNLNEDGTEMYTWNDVHQTGWREVPSRGTEFHQLTAPYIQGLMTTELPNKTLIQKIIFTRLNAKFCHNDGREVVFAYKSANDGILITDYPDKGTFNYSDDFGNNAVLAIQSASGAPHHKYDIEPYNKLMSENTNREEIEILTRENGGYKYNDDIIHGNTFYWGYDSSN